MFVSDLNQPLFMPTTCDIINTDTPSRLYHYLSLHTTLRGSRLCCIASVSEVPNLTTMANFTKRLVAPLVYPFSTLEFCYRRSRPTQLSKEGAFVEKCKCLPPEVTGLVEHSKARHIGSMAWAPDIYA